MKNTAKKVIDLLPKLKASLAQLWKDVVLVGVPSEETNRDSIGVTNATLAYIHDNGSPAQNIPARPFMLPGIEEAKPRVTKIFKASAIKTMKGNQGAMDQGLNKAGLVAQAAIRGKINEGIPPPLAEGTITARARRGRKGDKPLIDTGQLRNSINYVIRSK